MRMNEHLDLEGQPQICPAEASAACSASVGHELRNPLATVVAQTETLLAGVHGPLRPSQEAALNSIQDHVRQTLALIADMVELGRLVDKPAALLAASCALDDIVQHGLSQAGVLARSRSIKILSECSCGGMHVMADARRLAQMITELLNAAVLATPVDGQVRLLVSKDQGEIQLQAQANVSASTSFMMEADPEQSPAFQHLKKLKPIGMALLQKLVQLHQGRLTVGEADKQARTFSLHLKLSPPPFHGVVDHNEAAPVKTPHPADPAAATTRAPLILLADDQPALLVVTRNYLESLGFRVETARDGQEAVEMALRLHPSLIIMDVRMPVLDGLQAVRVIRAAADPGLRQIPIICASGMAVADDEEKYLSAGATGYFAKPYGIQAIDRLLAVHLPPPGRS